MGQAQGAVGQVRVITTGMGAGHPEHIYGTKKPALWWILTSKEWVDLPLNVFVIEHPDGLVLFDTGMDRAVMTDPDYWPGPVTRFLLDHIFKFDIGPDDTLTAQLEAAGYATTDVGTAVLSHLHADHAGGIAQIPDADLFVSKEAWDHMMGSHPHRKMVLRRDLVVPGAKWNHIEFRPTDDPALAPFTQACDLFGDRSMIVLPTPGHLAGDVSMLVRRVEGPPVLLIGDLTYSEDLLQRDQLPATGDHKLLLESFAKVRALKEHTPDLVIVAAHDTTAKAKLATTDRAGVRT